VSTHRVPKQVMYFATGVVSLFAPLVMTIMTPKWAIVVGSCGIVLWILLLLTENALAMIVGSAFCGCSSALLWVAQGVYTSRSRGGSKAHNMFWLMYLGCALTG
jgi:hypothetical protein